MPHHEKLTGEMKEAGKKLKRGAKVTKEKTQEKAREVTEKTRQKMK